MTIKKQFADSIKRGTGRAFLLMKQHSEIDFSGEIIDVSINDYGYDSQSEGSRAKYIYQFIKLSTKQPKIKKAVVEAFAKVSYVEDWTLRQLYGLIALYIKDGAIELKEALYKKYDEYDEIDFLGEEEILAVDGLKGLEHILTKNGRAILNGTEEYVNDFKLDVFKDMYPGIEYKKRLPQTEPIKAYFNLLDKQNKEQEQQPEYEYDFEDVLARLNTGKLFVMSAKRAKDIPEKDVLILADNYLKETNPQIKNNYLSLFGDIKFPYGYKPFFEIVKGRYSTNRQYEDAIDALVHFKSDEIRQLVLKKLKTKNAIHFIKLLAENYHPGDAILIKKILDATTDKDEVHSLGYSIVEIYQKNRVNESQAPLELLYYKQTCSICRSEAVNLLMKNQVLSDTIKEEIEYDCKEDTRKLYKKAKRK